MYYLVIIQKFNNGSPTAKALYDYESRDTAIATMFSTMASSMANIAIDFVVCMVLNENGIVDRYERWERPAKDIEEKE